VGSGTVPGTAATGDIGLFASAASVDVPGAISDVAFRGFAMTHP
jgi:hypothetical protein